jgi:broad specificity phosphatase PhoE
MAKCEANHLGSRDIVPSQLLSLDFLRSVFSKMKHLALILSIPLLLASAANATPVIFVVRHAEKATTGGSDPDLSVAGQKRAEALAHILKDSQITAVFVTEFKRTQETAAPTAKEAHVSPTVVPAKDVSGLVTKLRAVNGNALVVGHGNTIPDLVKALGIARPISIPEDDYTEILVVSVGDVPQLLRLRYPF